MNRPIVYYGEKECEVVYEVSKKSKKSNQKELKSVKCKNGAYFTMIGKEGTTIFACGLHSNRCAARVKLPENPNKAQNQQDAIAELKISAELGMTQNIELCKKGDVVVTKLYMMQKPEYIKGYLTVFPNFKHGSRVDGMGLPALSPKNIGPIVHWMPNLPPSKNLENFHQFAKVFSSEIDARGNVTKEAIEERISAYEDDIPHRHKPAAGKKEVNGNKNIPLFSVFYDKKGNEHRYTYLECRWFYCYHYEKHVSTKREFLRLKNMINEGWNLNISGYDGYNVMMTPLQHYMDTSKPFGHELVLYCMLVIENSNEYPWNIYYEQNKNKYIHLFFY